MNKDAELLAEAYLKVLEEAKHCKAAKDGCDCNKCEECKDNQTVSEGVDQDGDGKKDFDDVRIARMVASGMSKEEAIAKVKGKKKKDEENLKEAYETILEYKLINKKFARRYNKLTSAMLKAQPGSEEYGKIKAEREDLVSILKDHGMSPKDLEEYLVKKERENPLPEVQDQNLQTQNQYKDNSYTDTADLAASSDVSVSAAMENPSIEASAMAPDAPQAPQAPVAQ